MASRWLPGDVEALLAQDAPYPPALTGLRGSHAGSFETLHALRDGAAFWKTAGAASGHRRGVRPRRRRRRHQRPRRGAISSGRRGRTRASSCSTTTTTSAATPSATSSRHNGRTYIGYGGTQSIDSPAPYSAVAKALITDLGIDVAGYGKVARQRALQVARPRPGDVLRQGNLRRRSPRGRRRARRGVPRLGAVQRRRQARPQAAADREVRSDARATPSREKKDRLARISYTDFVVTHLEARSRRALAVPDAHARALRRRHRRRPGAGRVRPGPARVRRHGPRRQARSRAELRLDAQRGRGELLLPFPGRQCDSVARLLVRRLVPGAIPGIHRWTNRHERGRTTPSWTWPARRCASA